ncbi:MAG: hypothetical protein WCK91_00685 [bacterium]
MPKKTIIIFVSVFIAVGAIIYGAYYFFAGSGSKSGTTTGTGSGYQQFNTLGGSKGTTGGGTTGGGNTGGGKGGGTTGGGEVVASKFHKLTDFPIAGATFFYDTRNIPQVEGVKPDPTKPKFEIVPSLRYVERVTGHIDELYLDTKVVGEISNSTIPNIYESMFDSKASTVIYRYLSSDNSISSFIATLGGTKGDFLPSNIVDLSLSPDKTKFFYLIKGASGINGTIQNFTDGKKNPLFSSSYDEWLSQWVNAGSIFLTTKASGGENGYLYSLNTSNGSLKKIFGPVMGLTTNSNNGGTVVLYSNSFSGGVSLGLFDVTSHKTSDLGVSSLPEKCVWSTDNTSVYCAIPDSLPIGQYPDSWYQGLVSFSDHFIKINTKTSEVINLGTPNESIDATHMFTDDKEIALFFTNKKDSTLWSLDLK